LRAKLLDVERFLAVFGEALQQEVR